MKEKNESFNLVLENPKADRYIRFGFAFVIMNTITFILFLFFRDSYKAGIAGLVVIALYFVIKRMEKKRHPDRHWVDEHVFFLIAVVWVSQSIVLAICLALIGVLLRISLQKFSFTFSADGIRKNFFPKKKYEWDSIDSVILRAGLLTINFKNSHLIQGLIEDSDKHDEQQFNSFVNRFLQGDKPISVS